MFTVLYRLSCVRTLSQVYEYRVLGQDQIQGQDFNIVMYSLVLVLVLFEGSVV